MKKETTDNTFEMNEFDTVEKAAPQKAVKASSAVFYITLCNVINTLYSGLWFVAHVTDTVSRETGERTASRVSLAFKGVSEKIGRFAKIESGRLVAVYASLKAEKVNEPKDYRPSIDFSETVKNSLESAIVQQILNDKRLKAAFLDLYGKVASQLKSEVRDAIKAAFTGKKN